MQKLEAEWPAILRWSIDGCLEWQRIGLEPPAIVRDATDAYFADQDTLQQWLDDCTEDGGEFAFSRTHRAVRVMEKLVRKPQQQAGQRTSPVGSPRRSWLCEKAQQRRPTGLLQPHCEGLRNGLSEDL